VTGALRALDQVIYLAAQQYTPKLYRGRVAVFRGAKRPLAEEWDPAAGWPELWIADVRLDDTPGGHLTMFHPPGVSVLGERLRHLLGGFHERSGPEMARPLP
jgi:thioesterase domain-containing protein